MITTTIEPVYGTVVLYVINTNTLTCNVVAQNPWRDYASVGTEQRLQILLGHIFREARYVKVRTFYSFRTRSGVWDLKETHSFHTCAKRRSTSASQLSSARFITPISWPGMPFDMPATWTYLDCFVLQPQAVKGVDGLLSILWPVVVHESVSQWLTCKRQVYVYTYVNLSSYAVWTKFAAIMFWCVYKLGIWNI